MSGPEGAAAFLLRWAKLGGGLVSVTAIEPDGPTETRTFSADEGDALQTWLKGWIGRRNLYFMVNPPRARITRKASKQDVESLRWLHVDIDPRRGEDPGDARRRILAALEACSPRPTIAIWSGGGAQAFWRLAEAIPIRDTAHLTELEGYNRQQEVLLGGDNCHNIDRIMRVPGTINIPNQRKRAAGRTAVPTTVLWEDWDLTYPLETFKRSETRSTAGGIAEIVIGNLGDVDIDALQVSDRVKMVIVQGNDPDNPFPSRSEAVWFVTCSLVRAECDDDTIASILLDRDLRISDHILAQGRARDYAARTIARAREHAESPELAELNGRHAVVREGGRTRVINEEQGEGRANLTWSSFEDFSNYYRNRRIQVGTDKRGNPTYFPLGRWWLEHERRRTYDRVVFAPGREEARAYNLWRGFAVEARPGDWSLLAGHIRDNICRGDAHLYQYLINWLARTVQNPGEPGQVAVVLRGQMGTGKGVLPRQLGIILGQHYLHISNSRHLVGNFNSHLRDCVLLYADEAFWAGDKQGESTLKTLITEPVLVLEAKGRDVVTSPNCVHLFMTSNHDWVVPAGPEERRYFVLDVSGERMRDFGYFEAIEQQMVAGGREALLWDLLHMNLRGWEVRDVPATEALREQKILSMSTEQRWWYDKLMDGRLLRDAEDWETEVDRDRLQADYVDRMQKAGVPRRATQTELGILLKRLLPGDYPRTRQRVVDRVVGEDRWGEPVRRAVRTTFYALPDLWTCRRYFERVTEAFHPWPSSEEII